MLFSSKVQTPALVNHIATHCIAIVLSFDHNSNGFKSPSLQLVYVSKVSADAGGISQVRLSWRKHLVFP
jgi:hypothetical protein